jgi:hypothetical protein
MDDEAPALHTEGGRFCLDNSAEYRDTKPVMSDPAEHLVCREGGLPHTEGTEVTDSFGPPVSSVPPCETLF